MFHNYLKSTIRQSKSHIRFTFLNILGITVGLLCSLLIFLWVRDEVDTDLFHQKGFYQMLRNIHQAEPEIMATIAVPQPVKALLDTAYPEAEDVSLIRWEIELLFQNANIAFHESGRYDSPEFVKLFSYPFLAGDTNSAMNNCDEHEVNGRSLGIDNSRNFTIYKCL